MSNGFFGYSAQLHAIAVDAYKRAKDEVQNERAHGSSQPMVAVVFAAASLEGFINEIGESAKPGRDPEQVLSLGRLLAQAEDDRLKTTLKYQLASLALTGATFDEGAEPFQSFATLFELRNSLVHAKLELIHSVKLGEHDSTPPKVMKRMPSHLLAEFDDPNTFASWTIRIGTPAVARWACNAATNMVQEIVLRLPAGDTRQFAELITKAPRFTAF